MVKPAGKFVVSIYWGHLGPAGQSRSTQAVKMKMGNHSVTRHNHHLLSYRTSFSGTLAVCCRKGSLCPPHTCHFYFPCPELFSPIICKICEFIYTIFNTRILFHILKKPLTDNTVHKLSCLDPVWIDYICSLKIWRMLFALSIKWTNNCSVKFCFSWCHQQFITLHMTLLKAGKVGYFSSKVLIIVIQDVKGFYCS